MKRLFLILSLICFIAPFATSQSVQSDSLFAKGVELYNAGKYKDAIYFFKESDKLDKAQLDSTSNRRRYSSMWLASSYFHAGDTANAKQIEKYYYLQPVDRRLTVQSDSLSAIGTELFIAGRLDEARISYHLRDSVAALEYLLKQIQFLNKTLATNQKNTLIYWAKSDPPMQYSGLIATS